MLFAGLDVAAFTVINLCIVLILWLEETGSAGDLCRSGT